MTMVLKKLYYNQNIMQVILCSG